MTKFKLLSIFILKKLGIKTNDLEVKEASLDMEVNKIQNCLFIYRDYAIKINTFKSYSPLMNTIIEAKYTIIGGINMPIFKSMNWKEFKEEYIKALKILNQYL